jgi:hypothetical protein
MSQFFFPNTCHKCGAIGEAKFIIGSTHLKQVCVACGFYVKFFDKALVPNVLQIRQKIWFVSGQNKELIEQCKVQAEYTDGLSGLNEKIMWWNVYLILLKYKNMKLNEGYELIPLSDITDEAREIAVKWCESVGIDWIGDKHKLASDIMNYAKKYKSTL